MERMVACGVWAAGGGAAAVGVGSGALCGSGRANKLNFVGPKGPEQCVFERISRSGVWRRARFVAGRRVR